MALAVQVLEVFIGVAGVVGAIWGPEIREWFKQHKAQKQPEANLVNAKHAAARRGIIRNSWVSGEDGRGLFGEQVKKQDEDMKELASRILRRP